MQAQPDRNHRPPPACLAPCCAQVVLLQADNRLAMETFEEVVGLATEGCKAVASFMRGALLEHVQAQALARNPAIAGR